MEKTQNLLKMSDIMQKVENLFSKTWEILKENPKYSKITKPEFKIMKNSKERFCKYGLFSCPTLLQIAKNYDIILADLAKDFTEISNKILQNEDIYKKIIKNITHSKGYINIDVFDQSSLLLDEENKTSDNTSLYTTVVYNEKNEPTFLLKPIAHIETCFREKFGTPRQRIFLYFNAKKSKLM